MPRVGDLSKCKIYKITSLNNPELVYYGNTCQTLAQRFSSHKAPSNCTTSKLIIEKGDAIILLIEDYPCESENHANAREAFYIINNPCVNKKVPGRTIKESYKAYCETNKEQILIRQKKYRDSHKEKIKEYRESNQEQIQEYRDSNKEKNKEYQKEYRLKKKLEKLNV